MKLKHRIRNIYWKLSKIFLNRKHLFWRHTIVNDFKFKQGKTIPLDNYSPISPIKVHDKKRVVCICDGKIRQGGLADRLRGIVSVYEVCKEQGIDFKLIFNSPFELSQFLVPNKVNWQIQEDELNYNPKVTDICYIYNLSGTIYEAKKQKLWFHKEFKKAYREYHVRTNAKFSFYSDYATLFNELFKLSPRLQASIDKQKEILGTDYISTSFRFMNLLNDFNETAGVEKDLTKAEIETLINKNLEQIHHLHNKYPDKRILVNSDSATFLQRAVKFDYVYTIPGNITHIDGDNNSDEYSTYEKTFLDFFMIANAERIFLLRTGLMYNSGYPLSASMIYNKPFEKIEF